MLGDAPSARASTPHAGLAGLPGLPTFLEGRVSLEWLSLLNDVVWHQPEIPGACSRPVLLVPGFMASEASLGPMRRWLCRLGFAAEVAPVGLNAWSGAQGGEIVTNSARRMAADSGKRVVVVGHSRGGHHGTVAAVRAPDAVEAVVTLGTPLRVSARTHFMVRLSGDLLRSVGRLVATPSEWDAEETYERELHGAFPAEVRRVSVWSKSDGIVDWRASVVDEGRNVEVVGSHIGLAVNPQVYRALVSILERPVRGAERSSPSSQPTGEGDSR